LQARGGKARFTTTEEAGSGFPDERIGIIIIGLCEDSADCEFVTIIVVFPDIAEVEVLHGCGNFHWR